MDRLIKKHWVTVATTLTVLLTLAIAIGTTASATQAAPVKVERVMSDRAVIAKAIDILEAEQVTMRRMARGEVVPFGAGPCGAWDLEEILDRERLAMAAERSAQYAAHLNEVFGGCAVPINPDGSAYTCCDAAVFHTQTKWPQQPYGDAWAPLIEAMPGFSLTDNGDGTVRVNMTAQCPDEGACVLPD